MNPIAFVVVMLGCITAATIIAFRRESARLDESVAAFLKVYDFQRLSATPRAETGARAESPLGAGSTFDLPTPAQPAQRSSTGVGHSE